MNSYGILSETFNVTFCLSLVIGTGLPAGIAEEMQAPCARHKRVYSRSLRL